MTAVFSWLKTIAASSKASGLKWPRTTSAGLPAKEVQTELPKALGPDPPVPRRVHSWFEVSHTTARSASRSPEMSPVATDTVPVQPVEKLVRLKDDPLLAR